MTAKIIEDSRLTNRVLVFKDRTEAGKQLANMLKDYRRIQNVVLLALPAGGVPIAIEIAKELLLSLDVIIVRKLQIPWAPEAGFGAMTWDEKIVLNKELTSQLNLSQKEIFKIGFENLEEKNRCHPWKIKLFYWSMMD